MLPSGERVAITSCVVLTVLNLALVAYFLALGADPFWQPVFEALGFDIHVGVFR